MPLNDYDDIARRMETQATLAGDLEGGHPDLPRDPWAPRWRISPRWVEFQCGCVAERVRELIEPKDYDPVIFRGLPQQAVYAECCDRHRPGMNKYVQFGAPGLTFEQWKRTRRPLLMGKV